MSMKKVDLGLVMPTAAVIRAAIFNANPAIVDQTPISGNRDHLISSNAVYEAVNGIGNELTNLNTNLDAIIGRVIVEQLAQGQTIQSAIATALESALTRDGNNIWDALEAQGEDMGGLAQSIANDVARQVSEAMAANTELDQVRTTLDAIANLDLIRHLLDNDSDGEVDLGNIVLVKVVNNPDNQNDTDNHLVLDLREDGALNKSYYCISDSEFNHTPATGEGLTIVLPDKKLGENDLKNGDDVYIEFRAVGTHAAPVARIFTDDQYTRWASDLTTGQNTLESAQTMVMKGILTSENLAADAMYTRIRATFCYGKWMAEVVQFKDPVQSAATVFYDVVYNDNYAGLTWGTTVTGILKGSYQLMGRQASYCGMRHIAWDTASNGRGTRYALGQTIILNNDNTVAVSGQSNQRLTLYAVYESYTKSLSVDTSFPSAWIDTHYRTGCTYHGSGSHVGGKSAEIYNKAAFNSAVAGWGENNITIQISFWWKTMGAPEENSHVRASCGGTNVVETHTGPSGWTNHANAFQVTLTKSGGVFTLPTILTESNEGCIIPYVSGIIFS